MLNFDLHAFMWTLILIRQEYRAASSKAALSPSGTRMDEADRKRLLSNLESVAATLGKLYIAEDRLGTLQTFARVGGGYAEVAHELMALDSDVLSATKYERFYHYPRDKGLLVLRIPGDWADVLAAFPSASEDIRCAVDCYALAHPNASIHHSMMILERGLPLLAKRLRVTIAKNRATWGPIITDIRNEIDRRRAALAAPPRGTAPLSPAAARVVRKLLEPCEEAAIEFRYFTNVWRNHIAHGSGNYDDEEAKRVLEHVRTFMTILAAKLGVKERR
jgi:hypothetical protein